MSRSVKKTPIGGVCSARSESHDKKSWHRRLRRTVRNILNVCDLSITPELPTTHEVSDPWAMAKDGKMWYSSADPEVNQRWRRVLRK